MEATFNLDDGLRGCRDSKLQYWEHSVWIGLKNSLLSGILAKPASRAHGESRARSWEGTAEQHACMLFGCALPGTSARTPQDASLIPVDPRLKNAFLSILHLFPRKTARLLKKHQLASWVRLKASTAELLPSIHPCPWLLRLRQKNACPRCALSPQNRGATGCTRGWSLDL